MSNPKIQVFLTGSQKSKFLKREAFQLSHPQIEAGSGMHQVEIEMLPHHYNKLLTNASKKKGFRFSEGTIHGGSVVASFKKSARQALGIARQVIPKESMRKMARESARLIGEHSGNADSIPLLKNVADAGVDNLYSGSGVPAVRAICVRSQTAPAGMLVGSQSRLGTGVVDTLTHIGHTVFNQQVEAHKKGKRLIKHALRVPGVKEALAGAAGAAATAGTENPLIGALAGKATYAALDAASQGEGIGSYLRCFRGAKGDDLRVHPAPKGYIDDIYCDKVKLQNPRPRNLSGVDICEYAINPIHAGRGLNGQHICVVGGKLLHGVPRPIHLNIATHGLGVYREHGTGNGVCRGGSFSPL